MSIAIGTILIFYFFIFFISYFCLFANNARTAGLIEMGGAPIDVFRPRQDDGATGGRRGGTGAMVPPLAHEGGAILSFGPTFDVKEKK